MRLLIDDVVDLLRFRVKPWMPISIHAGRPWCF